MNLVLSLILLLCSIARADDVDYAKMLKQHGLIEDAKRLFISIVHTDASAADKAASLYNLGLMAFNEKNLQLALNTWGILLEKYPESEEGKRVARGIGSLATDMKSLSLEIVENSIARSYLQNAEFWASEIKNDRWIIDSSWLDQIELACEWYDRVIAEFPGTPSARLAYIEKFKTILGKTGIGESHDKYIDPLMNTYKNFAEEFPNDEFIPALRFQIAQVFWGEDTLAFKRQIDEASNPESSLVPDSISVYKTTEKWLRATLEGNLDSFYSQVARARLEYIEESRQRGIETARRAREAARIETARRARMQNRLERLNSSRWIYDVRPLFRTYQYQWDMQSPFLS